ncbi:hypothetical protein BUALT_Bualt08G0001200 [Buddleja alternifolia]|uniref:Uncharacterized protein n=1 Tax=Buddleja alternifolia TaxID=168488 RepID=A0AAV6XAK3_9LAMI|nr:hypothetical protein BUALT_Bualt08G0001200 [Buddleja alternifolia]
MGCCMSSESSSSSSSSSADYSTSRRHRKPSANVVSLTGELRQYPLPVTVSQVLQSETTASSSPDSFFICNSDRLYFDHYIPSLDAQEELESGQIYFLLPISKLHYRLAASDMAALAVKASVALQKINASRRNRKAARISPVLLSEDPQSSDHNHQVQIKTSSPSASATRGLGVSRSGSVRRKLTRYSSRRAKLAVRSFRIKLNTIHEGSVLLLN